MVPKLLQIIHIQGVIWDRAQTQLQKYSLFKKFPKHPQFTIYTEWMLTYSYLHILK